MSVVAASAATCCGVLTLAAAAATVVTSSGSYATPSSTSSSSSSSSNKSKSKNSGGVKAVRVRRYPLIPRGRPRHLPRLPSRPRPPPTAPTPPPVLTQPKPTDSDFRPPWALRPPPLGALTPPSSSENVPGTQSARSSESKKIPSMVCDSPKVEVVLECGARRRRRKTGTVFPRKPTTAWKTPPPSSGDDRDATVITKEDFCAHSGAVNCLALGHKSGRVLATGGDDKKVNLWAVGKPNCIISLSGHTTSVECVRFGGSEELVCAGSQSGALKIWDLEATKIVRTLTGHKSNIRTIDFHPYGDFIGTGSLDTNIKLWDIRRKGCIFTYKGHNEPVNCLKFSPDGQWIASAGEDYMVKLWDLRAGKLLTEFEGHVGPVTDVEFHPHEFLLASSSLDRTVKFWDLEKFYQISSSTPDAGPIRCVVFDPEGKQLYAGCPDVLRLYSWEPYRTIDTLAMGWGKVSDLAVANTQLIGAHYHGTHVSLYVVDMERIGNSRGGKVGAASPLQQHGGMLNTTTIRSPSDNVPSTNFHHGVSARKSFSRDRNNAKANAEQMKTEEASDTGGEDPNEDDPPAHIANLNEFSEVFGTRRELQRTPPPETPQPWTNNNEPVTVSGDSVPSSINRRMSASSPAPPPHSSSPPSSLQHRPYTAMGNTITRSQSITQLPQASSGGSSISMLPRPSNRRASTQELPSFASRYSQQHHSSSRSDEDYSIQRPRAVSESRKAGYRVPQCPSPTNRFPLRHSPSEPQLVLEGSAPPSLPAHSPPSPPSSLSARPPDVANISRGIPSSKPDLTQHPAFRNSPQHHSPDLTRHSSTSPYHHTSHSDLSSHRSYPAPGGGGVRSNFSRSEYARQTSQPQPEITYLGTPKDVYKNSQPDVSYLGTPKDFSSFSSISSSDVISDRRPMNAFDDCLPMKLGGLSLGGDHVVTLNAMSEPEVLNYIAKGHTAMLGALVGRARLLRSAYSLWHTKDLRSALDHTLNAADQSSLIDLLNIVNKRPFIWNLDIVTMLLPSVSQLLQSRHEPYVTVGCNALKLMLKNFGSMIRSNMRGPVHTVGVDISREERRNKCIESYNMMMSIRALVQKRQTLSGTMGHTYRELYILMQVFD